MGIIQRSYFDAAQKGRDAAQQEQGNALLNQARQQNIEQNAYENNLARQQEPIKQQAAQDAAQAEQVKQFATQMHSAAQYAQQAPPGQTKPFIERNFPFLVQAYGPDWANATEEQVHNELLGISARSGVQAGIAPPQPKTPSLITGVGADGKPTRVVDAPGVTPYERPPGKGISVTSPDGTQFTIGGDGSPDYSPQDFSKATRTGLEKAFVDAQGNAYALRAQLGKYKDEYSTAGGRLKAGIAGAKDYMGMENAPQQQQFLSEFTSWKADTASLLSQYLNQLSGAAISPAEEARLKSGFPNADDGPTVYKAKADATMRKFALVQARAAYLLSSPGVKLDSVSLESMSNIIALEANKLAKSLEKGGMDAESAKQKAINDTRARFGLNQ